MSKKKPPIDDIAIFEEAVKGIKPLVQNKIILSKHKNQIILPKKFSEQKYELQLLDSSEIESVPGDAFIAYKQDSVSNKILRKLRKGQYNVEAVLDLHGFSVKKAQSVVEQFLIQCLQDEVRVLLIIHGKGHHSQMPILKNKLNHWLRHLDVVLAFCSAAPSHGSRGATYVLLKRMTQEDEVG